ncbi:hypothetical protein MNBD_GAMMA11-458 [hydrothermal vent metagenome]|uniref:Tripartite ATP-independent periplasmic transporters DctQ component domain-containing protein n=1 Tax=hydrothermal vent metagenome TaxID=652676 RepID=A0A3B0WWU4_9ZZZZ
MSLSENIIFSVRKNLVFFEKTIAGISLLLLLILALSQVILRNVFDTGFSDIDVISRHLVLFIAFMGAALATDSNQHIKVDCLNSIISTSFKTKIKRPLILICTIISGIFCWYAGRFWLDERLYAPNNEQLALYMALILPLGFFTLSLHFLLLLLSPEDHHLADT